MAVREALATLVGLEGRELRVRLVPRVGLEGRAAQVGLEGLAGLVELVEQEARVVLALQGRQVQLVRLVLVGVREERVEPGLAELEVQAGLEGQVE